MSGNLGLGNAPLGISLFGFGSPAQAPALAGNILETSPGGASNDARYIDPTSGDYVIDSLGRVEGESTIAQAVYLSIATTLGSSAIQTLGNELWNMKTIDPGSYKTQAANYIYSALQSLTASAQISILKIDINLVPDKGSAITIAVTWIDNTSDAVNQTVLSQ